MIPRENIGIDEGDDWSKFPGRLGNYQDGSVDDAQTSQVLLAGSLGKGAARLIHGYIDCSGSAYTVGTGR